MNGGALMHTLGDLKKIFTFIFDMLKKLYEEFKGYFGKDDSGETTGE